MKILVHAKPGAKQERIEQIDATTFSIAVREPARENKANFAILAILARRFAVPGNHISLISGRTSKEKLFEVMPCV